MKKNETIYLCVYLTKNHNSICVKNKEMKKHSDNNLNQETQRPPLWVVIIVIASILPVLLWPVYMSRYGLQQGGQTAFLATAFPIYIVLCGYLAYKCYQYRREVTYVLLVIMWLSYGAAVLL